MSNKVSGAFKSGHNRGYKEGRSYQSKSEVAKWVDAASGLLFGTSRSNHSKDYKKGRNTGWNNSYGKR